MKEYHLNQIIGEGASSTIYSAFLVNSPQEEVAIKILKNTPKTLSYFEAELQTLQSVTHPNIINIHSSHKSQRHLYIIMEKMDMSLTKFITDNFLYVNFDTKTNKVESKEYFNERVQKVLKIIRMVLLGINVLHKKGIIHRDIKLGNILVNSKSVKLCDFGLSTNKEKNNTFCGTEDYLAPEVIKKEKYDNKIDIYGAGLVLFILLTNQKYSESQYKILENNKRLSVYSGDMIDFLKGMINAKPTERFSAEDALKHKIFSEFWCLADSFINIEDITYQTKLGVIRKKGNIISFNNIELKDYQLTTFYNCGCINHAPLFSLTSYYFSDLVAHRNKRRPFKIEILINKEKHEFFDIPHNELKKVQFLLKFIKNMRRKTVIFQTIPNQNKPTHNRKDEDIKLLEIFLKNTIFERKANGDFLYVRILNLAELELLYVELKYGLISMHIISIPLQLELETVFEKYNNLLKSYKDSNSTEIEKLDQTDITILKYFLNESMSHESHECMHKQRFHSNVLTKFSSDKTTQLLNYNKTINKIEIIYKNEIWILIKENLWIFLFKNGLRIEVPFSNNIIGNEFVVIFDDIEKIFSFYNVNKEVSENIPYLGQIVEVLSD
ncbi:putative serine/threonine-protein kinase [Cucumispora dikerogammari]|nr:putative serine/threonine-protein kinase [Cucumispora dikerogammari]